MRNQRDKQINKVDILCNRALPSNPTAPKPMVTGYRAARGCDSIFLLRVTYTHTWLSCAGNHKPLEAVGRRFEPQNLTSVYAVG